MVRQITVTFAALLLSATMMSGCASVTDGATEDIRINIAGTGEALCDVTQPGRRYRVYAPSTMRVMRSKDDLRIRCKAPGNREQVVVLKSVVSDKFSYNAATLGLGALYDAESGAMYTYPDTILVDFSNMAASGYPQPDYQDVLDKYPELQQMEQFRPGEPALGSDRGTSVPTMQLRTGEEDDSMGIMMPAPKAAVTTTTTTTTTGAASTTGASTLPQGPSLVTPPVSTSTPASKPSFTPATSVASPGTTSSATGTGATTSTGTTSTTGTSPLGSISSRISSTPSTQRTFTNTSGTPTTTTTTNQ